MTDLFDSLEHPASASDPLAKGAVLLRGFAAGDGEGLMAALGRVVEAAPFRRMTTPGGFRMAVAMTNCGDAGWITDRAGYRYATRDPLSGQPWPRMPESFAGLAARAAAAAGYSGFAPDSCLINRYAPGARLTLHQDRNERDMRAPIVSVSLGLPATFLFGGVRRSDPARRIRLASGDVAVWGDPARLFFHGVAPLAGGDHPLTGECRINLTFRRAL
jgi:alkylated DNA repair protein (DNA oxidative demethylase)